MEVANMVIQIDTREKERAIKKIVKTFDDFLENGIKYFSFALPFGDYANFHNKKVIIDRKQNLGELAGNICGPDHARFSKELSEAKEYGVHMIILIEDDRIDTFEDVKKWKSPHTKVKGETLYKAMKTMESEIDKYDVEFRFCKKCETGEQIIKILMEAA
jgi:uncharacterized FlaG/YvyC family protein